MPLSLRDFFDGVRAGRLYVQRCSSCDELAVPPKAFCPSCRSTAWERAPLAGDGEIASFTVIRVPPGPLAARAPYAIAVVKFPEGVSLLGRVEGLPLEALRIGLPVRFVPPADPAANPPVIAFGPREPASSR
ncbi:MAG: Zn-ribbon domain-containing OB-fold protein [Candidatus Rokuibacteriota bacterium]